MTDSTLQNHGRKPQSNYDLKPDMRIFYERMRTSHMSNGSRNVRMRWRPYFRITCDRHANVLDHFFLGRNVTHKLLYQHRCFIILLDDGVTDRSCHSL